MIRVTEGASSEFRFETPQQFAELSPAPFDAQQRMNAAAGKAVDFHAWYKGWKALYGKQDQALMPTHLQVTAVDEFRAIIPWEELNDAFFVYEQEHGAPLAKGFPIRLYTPNGSSDCLNVKSVIDIRICSDESLGDRATFGFKNVLTPEELLSGRRSTKSI